MNTRICNNPNCHLAGQEQPIENFHWMEKKREARRYTCKVCRCEARRKAYVKIGRAHRRAHSSMVSRFLMAPARMQA